MSTTDDGAFDTESTTLPPDVREACELLKDDDTFSGWFARQALDYYD